jgi:DNA-binding NtrC family response regulator
MNTIAATSAESILSRPLVTPRIPTPKTLSTIVIVTNDAKMRVSLSEILGGNGSGIECVDGVRAANELFSGAEVAACLCGFGLEDGTYKGLVKLARRQSPEIPVIIVSTPSCSNEYSEYLAAMNAGAFDFLCYPYQRREVERILRLAVTSTSRIAR